MNYLPRKLPYHKNDDKFTAHSHGLEEVHAAGHGEGAPAVRVGRDIAHRLRHGRALGFPTRATDHTPRCVTGCLCECVFAVSGGGDGGVCDVCCTRRRVYVTDLKPENVLLDMHDNM